jgi:hypothetical protein
MYLVNRNHCIWQSHTCQLMTMFLRRHLGDALASWHGLSLGVMAATTKLNMVSTRPALVSPWCERRGKRRLEALLTGEEKPCLPAPAAMSPCICHYEPSPAPAYRCDCEPFPAVLRPPLPLRLRVLLAQIYHRQLCNIPPA